MKNQNNTFSTDSFLLASFLLSQSCILLSTDKNNPRRVVFIFQETEQRKKLTEDFLTYKGIGRTSSLF